MYIYLRLNTYALLLLLIIILKLSCYYYYYCYYCSSSIGKLACPSVCKNKGNMYFKSSHTIPSLYCKCITIQSVFLCFFILCVYYFMWLTLSVASKAC